MSGKWFAVTFTSKVEEHFKVSDAALTSSGTPSATLINSVKGIVEINLSNECFFPFVNVIILFLKSIFSR